MNLFDRLFRHKPPEQPPQAGVSPDWAQVLTRMQQLYNQGCTLVRLMDDGQGRVRVEPDA